VGSVTSIVEPACLRSFLIEAVERGIRRAAPLPDRVDGPVVVH